MDTNLLQGVGLFLCVGALILFAVLAFAASAFARRNRNNAAGQQGVFDQQQRGHERPTYDSQRVQSQGGFGGSVNTYDRDEPIPQTGQRRQSGFGVDNDLADNDMPNRPVNRDRRRDEDDDDNVRSSGGFGT